MKQEMLQLIRKIVGLDSLATVHKCVVHHDGVTVTFFALRGETDDRDDLYEDPPGSSLKYDVFYAFEEED